ncbi:bacillithiol biosynthesis cysteine-adding enzyme BshC [Alicyclobacillus sp. ALC3]|uniref:bacillithiol biosynthesis cysteine-adding enzyme BshC n=1 Tax=Alicyclobacillus sp. ALC3 TaxID=2796143 RepID=UPI002377F92D|nr:bacillithiol biosynthesis cysteine-adding enzyme BshC [Alicyclobacillus sp. ALC3]WDL97453.1 bacillithiol biosynthesis cysteine-adding enzyme BshC [Alicyclobacillus sp. ALC3]
MNLSVRTEPTGNRLADLHATAFAEVAHLYDNQNPTLLDTYRNRAAETAPRFTAEHREQLVDVLRAYMSELHASEQSFSQLERLRDSEAVAVVTGQQAGLFTGPVLTVYKALSAVGLARRLEKELGRPVVPVFWIASEDHDWAEVNHAYLLDQHDDVRRIVWPTPPEAHTMVYHHPLNQDDVDFIIRDAFLQLPDGPAKADVLRMFRDCWENGDSLSTWFGRVMAVLFRDQGLVILDPCLPGLRELVRPVWQTALGNVAAVQAGLEDAYREVERLGLEPTVIRDRENSTVFHVINGQRYVLESNGPGTLRVRGLGISKTVAQWQELANIDPTRFSSNVLLRPVVQDALLPTLAYVGGPAEISYHALSRAVFHAHGRKLPPLLLRQRVICYPASVVRNLAKWQIPRSELEKPGDLVAPRLGAMGFTAIEAEFEQLTAATQLRWDEFADRIGSLGPQVFSMARAQADREKSGIDKLKKKTQRLFEQRHKAAIAQLRNIERWLWTDGHLQERRLCLLNFLSVQGLTWIDQLPAWGDYDLPAPVYHIHDARG